jgi:hypothetical protein
MAITRTPCFAAEFAAARVGDLLRRWCGTTCCANLLAQE